MAVKPEEIASIIRQQIEQFGGAVTAVDVGTVVEAGDGIARCVRPARRHVRRVVGVP